MTRLRTLSRDLWKLDQYLSTDCYELLQTTELIAPLWDRVYEAAYNEPYIDSLTTTDNHLVRMVPYKLWQLKFDGDQNLMRALFMLSSMGLLGIEENDVCSRKEWLFYVVNEEHGIIKWHCDVLNTGARKAPGLKLIDWMKNNLANGSTNHQMVCGDGWTDSITIGVPPKLARNLFRCWRS